LSVLVRTGSNCAVDCNQFGLVWTGFFAVRSGPSLFGNRSSLVFSKKGKKTGLNLTFKPYTQIPTCHLKTHTIGLSGTRTQSQIPQIYISSPIGLVAPVGQHPGIPLSLSSHCADSQSLLIESFLAVLQIQSVLPSQRTDLHLHSPSSFPPSFSVSFFPILSPHVSLSPFWLNVLVSTHIYNLCASRPSVIKVLIPYPLPLLDYKPAKLTCMSTCTFMLIAWASVDNGQCNRCNRCKIVHTRDRMGKRQCGQEIV